MEVLQNLSELTHGSYSKNRKLLVAESFALLLAASESRDRDSAGRSEVRNQRTQRSGARGEIIKR
jgi:hypothetical protein